ncbi:MAG: hypothetical protein H0X08_04320 [Blastocatellia bacterium]|nr:hypothetical protein [Blastocatellia bacterium]
MPLGLVAEVMNNGGYLPQLAALSKQTSWITRRNGLGSSVIWLFFFLFLTALGGGVMQNENFGSAMALIGVFGAAMIFLFSMIFLKPEPKGNRLSPATIAELSGVRNHAALPSTPAAYHNPQRTDWRDTSDLEPTSVTDSTTRLLEKNPRD